MYMLILYAKLCEEITEQAEKDAAITYQREMATTIKEELRQKFVKIHNAEAEKNQLAQELKAEWEATRGKEIEARIEKDCYAKMSQLFGGKQWAPCVVVRCYKRGAPVEAVVAISEKVVVC